MRFQIVSGSFLLRSVPPPYVVRAFIAASKGGLCRATNEGLGFLFQSLQSINPLPRGIATELDSRRFGQDVDGPDKGYAADGLHIMFEAF